VTRSKLKSILEEINKNWTRNEIENLKPTGKNQGDKQLVS
jgi:hypothetical protein